MGSVDWYRVDPSKVAHETIEGEVIMIHLVLGTYFSLNGMGADVWRCLVEGREKDETLGLLEQRYDADRELIDRTVRDLLVQLAEEELVEPGEPAGASAPAAPAPSEKRPLVTPELQKYTDMQDFLLVDPIHEVDESGWLGREQAS